MVEIIYFIMAVLLVLFTGFLAGYRLGHKVGAEEMAKEYGHYFNYGEPP